VRTSAGGTPLSTPALMIGKKIALPLGIWHFREAFPPTVPPRKNTGEDGFWFTAQCTPVASRMGCVEPGAPKNHRYHSVCHSAYDLP